MGKEVITDKETHENPVVDGTLEVLREGQVEHVELLIEILTKDI